MTKGETPQDALIREFMEETRINIKPLDIIGIRFNMHDWYIAFRAEYVSGEADSDNAENSEVLWVDVSELTKILIQSAITKESGLNYKEYRGNPKDIPYSLYCI